MVIKTRGNLEFCWPGASRVWSVFTSESRTPNAYNLRNDKGRGASELGSREITQYGTGFCI